MFYVGVDLGQTSDPTAIAVVQKMDRGRPFRNGTFDYMGVRRVERIPLGTPYPVVVERVKETVQRPELRGQCVL